MARLRQWLRCALPGLVLLGVGMATAGAAPYSEPLERSDWQLTEEDAACRIQQTVRHGGTLRFEARPGLLTAVFWQAPYAMPAGVAPRLRTGAPEWLRPATQSPLDVRLQPRDARLFRVPQALAQPLKARLLAGHDARIDFPDGDDSVHFRGIRFALRARDFRACYGEQDTPAATPEAGALDRWSVYFETGSHRLDAEAREVLEQAARILADSETPRIRVVGWTDAAGPLEINRPLSRNRAEVVRDALAEAGLSAARVEIEAPGVDPAADGARQASRRSDIWWLDTGDSGAGGASVEVLPGAGTEEPEGHNPRPDSAPAAPSETPAW
ncbi:MULTISPECIES: OmpA family protein [unclassified Thioalkalivibrio]|uniref:OmpA family protein n=1 Tax=unclassified Thioalkalivibrio TaxID=2621013 RepID=UPI00037C5846|nr:MULTISPECIES: OmpA family protein [unclassified Thioalkalivibrio]